MQRTFLTLVRLLALASALSAPGCQLVVDFDRDLIVPDAGRDAGAADGSTSDMDTDGGADSGPVDLGSEDTGTDLGADAAVDDAGTADAG